MTPTRSIDLRSPVVRRVLGAMRWVGLVMIALTLVVSASRVMGQTGAAPSPTTTAAPASTAAQPPAPAGASAPATENKTTLMSLFMQSFDLFTILLVIGSLVGWTIIIICIFEIRQKNIAPPESEQVVSTLLRAGNYAELRRFVGEDDALVSRVVLAAMSVPTDDRGAMREAGELAASEESSRWFRKLEPLNVIGNMGPLLGLAGTVWGMIIAFAALGQSGGQANPATLSIGISKALFHTLLGLMLAVPCLCVFGFYRSLVDKLCTRAMVVASELIELLPVEARARLGNAGTAAQRPAPQPGAGAPRPPAGR